MARASMAAAATDGRARRKTVFGGVCMCLARLLHKTLAFLHQARDYTSTVTHDV